MKAGFTPVSEIYYAMQGEGMLIGQPTIFVRTGGCDYRCLAAGTLVTMHDLTQKPIELLSAGDVVLGYARVNQQTEDGPLRLVSTPVVAVRSLGLQETVKITLDDGTELLCSEDHRWWVEKLLRSGWVHKSSKKRWRGLEGNYKEAREIQAGWHIKGFGLSVKQPKETDSWRRGYLRGAFDGDGHISDAWVAMRVTSRTFFDAVVAVSALVNAPLVEYAEGVTTRGTPLYRSRLPEAYREQFLHAIAWEETAEYARGYLAGIFDAEGHVPSGECYYTQNVGTVYERIQHALRLAGYKFRCWTSDGRAYRVYVEENATAFLTQIDIRCAHKRAAAASRGMVQQRKQVVSIEKVAAMPLFDIQTGTQNFLANGMVSHNCSWCDSMFAVDPTHSDSWQPMTGGMILTRVLELAGSARPIITLSGGNPAIHKYLGEFVELAQEVGFQIAIETQGTILPQWATMLDVITLSPKPPSSKMQLDMHALREWLTLITFGNRQGCMKVPVGDMTDLTFAYHLHETFPEIAMYVQPVNTTVGDIAYDGMRMLAQLRWLSEQVLTDRQTIIVLPQLHTLLFGNQRRK